MAKNSWRILEPVIVGNSRYDGNLVRCLPSEETSSFNKYARKEVAMVLNAEEKRVIQKCWFLTGATATGKSELSIRLADRLNSEIISMDSMAIYQGMDLGTAKPSMDQRQAVVHHMIDILPPDQDFSVSQFRDQSLSLIESIHQKGKTVLFVGGTALYLQAMLKGIFEGPPADWEFRNQIEKQLDEHGKDALFEHLKSIDPLSAEKLHPNDTRRITRALEVFHITGKPISHQQKEFDRGFSAEQCRVFWLHPERETLHQRIEKRIGKMFQDGLVEEVEGLLKTYGNLSRSAKQAVGYKEVIEFLEGKMDQEQMMERVLVHTRKFARQQETWFRNLEESRQIDLEKELDSDDAFANQIVDQIIQQGSDLQEI